MAISYLSVKFHSRSNGHKAVAGAAYRAGEKLYDERYDETHDFDNRDDVKYSNVMLPEGADARFSVREFLWNQVEFAEKRVDSQVAIDYVLALPRELPLDQQIELARDFARYHFVDNGLVVDLAIHDKGDGNPHAHIYTTTRRLIDDQFDRLKARDLMPIVRNGYINPEEEQIWHEKYREFQDAFFKAKGISLEVDLNHIIPLRHEGRIDPKKETHYLQAENKVRHETSVDIALNDPESLLNFLGNQQAVFNDRMIAKTLNRYTQSVGDFQNALAKVIGHKDCVSLGIGEDGRETYTTRSNYLREAQMADRASALLVRRDHCVPTHDAALMKDKFSLSPEQDAALMHLASSGDIAVLVGRAGTGKSYLMKATKEMWEQQGYRVSGVAISGIASKNLSDETGMPTATLHSFKQSYLYSKETNGGLSSKDIIVLDEAGMVDSRDMANLVDIAHSTGAKLVLVGDPEQLQPIGLGAPLRALASRVGVVTMEQIRRQEHEGDRQASLALSQGNVGVALDHYVSRDALVFVQDKVVEVNGEKIKDRSASYQAVITDWLASRDPQSLGSQLILAHRNADVQNLNGIARSQLIQAGLLPAEGVVVTTLRDKEEIELELAPGDRLLFLRNDKTLNVQNGQLATVVSIKEDAITVLRDGQATPFTFSTNDYKNFDHGYAATVHKTQGVTIDRTFVYAGGTYWNRHLAYVALTRHRENVKLYASSHDHGDIASLKMNLARDEYRDNVLDFPLSYAERRGFNPESLMGKFIERVMGAKEKVNTAWLFVSNYEAYLLQKAQKDRDFAATDRHLAKRAALYIDQIRALNKERYELSQALPGKTLYLDARYTALFEKQVALNKEAHSLWAERQSLDTVFTRNAYSLEKLETATLAHTRHAHIERYLEAYQKNHGASRRRVAVAIFENSREHFASLSYLCAKQGLSLRDVQSQIKLDARSVERTHVLSRLSLSEKQDFLLVERYLSAQAANKSIWRNVYARDDEPATREKTRLLNFTTQQDRLALQIVAEPERYRHALHFYDIDTDKLIKQSDRHPRREAVKSLNRLVAVGDRREIAQQLLSDRANYPLIFEQEADWKSISKLAREHEHTVYLRGLTTEERTAYDQVERYQRARFETAKVWTSYFDLEAKERPNLREALKLAQHITQKRDELAYELFLNKESVAPFIEKTRLSLGDISKHAKRHRDALVQLNYKLTGKRIETKVPAPTVSMTIPGIETLQLQPQKTFDAKVVTQALVDMGEEFYTLVLGSEFKRAGGQLRFGHKGSLSVNTRGAHAGAWHSFETDEGGYPLQLLMNSTYGWGLSFNDALHEGARLAGVSPALQPIARPTAPIPVKPVEKENGDAKRLEEKMAAARYYWQSAKTIDGTLAETYLRDVRKISGDLSAFRFHERIKDPDTKHYYPGIVVAATNSNNEITAVQTILLGPDGRKASKENGLNVIKRSRGVVKGSAVLIHSGKSEGEQKVVIAEGPETAASLIAALPDAHIYVTLGNISNAAELAWLAEKHNTQQLYFAADNDGAYGQSIQKIHDVAQKLKMNKDIDCFIVKPHLPGKSFKDKVDFNDVLMAQGVEGVKAQVNRFDRIAIEKLKPILDDKSLEEGFTGLVDEWKRLEKQYHPDLKGLASSRKTIQNENTPEAVKHIEQKTYQEHVENIYCDDDLADQLKKIAPGIAKIVQAQGEKIPGLKVDWLSHKCEAEWRTLGQSQDKKIQELFKDILDFKNTSNPNTRYLKARFLNEDVAKLVSDKTIFTELKLKAPTLTKQMQQYHNRAKERNRGKSL